MTLDRSDGDRPGSAAAPGLSAARLYLVAGPRLAAGPLADLVPDLAGAGVDLVQLRAKDLEAGPLIREGRRVAAACREAGVPFVINDRPDVALALGADGVHLGRDDVPPEIARRIVPDAFLGGSTHSPEQIDAAASQGWDYIAVGPVHATPTKPGRPATGTALVRYAHGRAPVPWFAIGGIDRTNLAEVLDAGARRVVVVRAIADAADPVAAAAELRAVLDDRPDPDAPSLRG